MLTPVLTLPTACAVNTMIGTLPWMAELTHQPKPILRVLTFTGTLIVDIALVLAPVIAWLYGKFHCIHWIGNPACGCIRNIL